jgi:lipoyl-dependent peroxiredoxin
MRLTREAGYGRPYRDYARRMGRLQATAQVDWAGMRGSVHGGSGALRAPTSTQAELGGPGEGTNPEELLAAAHANCFTSTLTSLARRRELTLDRIETAVTYELVWEDGRGDHHLASSRIRVRVGSDAPWEDVQRLVRAAEEECPVCRAIAGNVTMHVELEPIPS